MRIASIAVIVTTLFFLGCETTPHYNRTKVVSLIGAPTEVRASQRGKIKPYDSVKLFQAKEEVKADYDVIALLSVEGNAGEEAAFFKAFLYRAADLGADAIILYRVSLTAGMEGGLSVVGNSGGFALPMKTTHEAFYRAEAIRFK